TLVGVPLGAVAFVSLVIYCVWRLVRRLDRQRVRGIFEFYVAANEVLYDGERHWYGFELTEVIDSGEDILHTMTDPPILVRFAVGALYHRMGQHRHAIEELACVAETTHSEEDVTQPSPLLRRYVRALRQLERYPERSAGAIAAMRNLELARREKTAAMLVES